MKKKQKPSNKKVLEKFHNNLRFQLEVRPSQIPNSGNGLITLEFIPAESFLGYYEAVWSLDKKTQSNYSFYINDKITLDIDISNKPYSAMMNDAFRTDFKNNIEAVHLYTETDRAKITKKNYLLFDPSKMVGLYALRDIYPGEELFFSYGESYWKSW